MEKKEAKVIKLQPTKGDDKPTAMEPGGRIVSFVEGVQRSKKNLLQQILSSTKSF